MKIGFVILFCFTGCWMILIEGCCKAKEPVKAREETVVKKKDLFRLNIYSDEKDVTAYFVPATSLDRNCSAGEIRERWGNNVIGQTPVEGYKSSTREGTVILMKEGFYTEFVEVRLDSEEPFLINQSMTRKIDGMAFVKGGTFSPGKASDASVCEVGSFYIMEREVTIREYRVYCDKLDIEYPHKKYDRIRKVASGNAGETLPEMVFVSGSMDDCPVTFVAWYDAVEYCNWRSESESLQPCYTILKKEEDATNLNDEDYLKWTVQCDFMADGYRLPIELEWEYASRGGPRGRGFQFSGDDIADEAGWYRENALDMIHPVGRKKANELGIYDMSGNAAEWCGQWYAVTIDRTVPLEGTLKSVRGGGWRSSVQEISPVYRKGSGPQIEDIEVGFRMVRTAK